MKIPVVLGVFFFARESGFDFGLGFAFGFAADFLVPPAATVLALREEEVAARDAGARSDLKTLAAREDISR